MTGEAHVKLEGYMYILRPMGKAAILFLICFIKFATFLFGNVSPLPPSHLHLISLLISSTHFIFCVLFYLNLTNRLNKVDFVLKAINEYFKGQKTNFLCF